MVFAYFCTRDNVQAANQVKMAQIGEFTPWIRTPFVVAADFNMEPDQLWEAGRVQSLGQKANIVVPEVVHTCTKGRGRARCCRRGAAGRQGGVFEAPRPQMLEVGEVLAAPALEDLIPARPLHGKKSRRSRGEVLVATEVAYGNRDDCFGSTPPLKALRFVVSSAASRGRRLAFFDVVAAFVHALIDGLVILLLRNGLGQGRTAVLHKALHGTRKASRLLQRFLRGVPDDAGWKASVIFTSVHTLGDQRGTLGCWGNDLLVEEDEQDLDAVEACLKQRLEVKVRARIGGKSSGEAGFLKRVTESFFWCSGYVEDAVATLQVAGRIYTTRTHLARRARVRRGCAEAPGCVRRQRLGRRRGAETLDHWSCRDLRAEFCACNRGTAGGLQTCHFLTEACYMVTPRVWSDSSACRGIVRRRRQAQTLKRSGTCGHRNGCREESSC